MARKNISFDEYDDGSYNLVDRYFYDKFFKNEDSYNYYDIDVDKILSHKKSDNKYFIRYNYVNKMNVVPLQLKIKNFFGEIHDIKNNIILMSIQSNDKELFKKFSEIWNRIIELMGINNTKGFVKNTIDDDNDEFIMVNAHKNKFFVEGKYRDKHIIVLHSVIDNQFKTSLIKVKTHK